MVRMESRQRDWATKIKRYLNARNADREAPAGRSIEGAICGNRELLNRRNAKKINMQRLLFALRALKWRKSRVEKSCVTQAPRIVRLCWWWGTTPPHAIKGLCGMLVHRAEIEL